MRKFFPVEELARDERFNKITMRDRMADPRSRRGQRTRIAPARPPTGSYLRAPTPPTPPAP